MGISVSQVATALKIHEQQLADVLATKAPVTLDLAMRLSCVVGQSADYWLLLQGTYDVAQSTSLAEELDALEPLVSAYWGRPVACFSQEIPWLNDKTVSCLVTCAFSGEGRPTIVLTQRSRYLTPSLASCFEYHAIACLNAVNAELDAKAFRFRDERGFSFFVAHCARASQAAFAGGNATLNGVSTEGNFLWAEHYLEGTETWKAEQASIVYFQYENTPTFAQHLSGAEFQALVGTEVRTLAFRHARH